MASSNYFLRLVAVGVRLLPDIVKQAIYRLPFLSSGIRALLNRVSPVGLTEVIATSGPLAGKTLYLDLQSEKFYWLGTYEPQLMHAIKDLCCPSMTVYDVGANIGYISLVFAQVVSLNGVVVAFEPLPSNVERIRYHIRANKLANILKVEPFAVADQSGIKNFLIHSAHSMGKIEGSEGRHIEYSAQIQVETVTLDEFCYERRNPVPDLIKMDIEGGAVQAVKGMTRLIAQARPVMLVELHGPEEAQAVWDLLTQNAYSIHRMDEKYSTVTDFSQLDWKEYLIGLPVERVS